MGSKHISVFRQITQLCPLEYFSYQMVDSQEKYEYGAVKK